MLKKTFIILLVFVSFYLCAHYWIRWRNQNRDDASKTTRLVECDPNDVKGIQIFRRNEAPLSFSRKDAPEAGVPPAAKLAASEWRYESPTKAEADAQVLTRLATMFCEIHDPAEARPADFAPADGPVEKIVFQLGERGAHSLLFGKPSADRMVLIRHVSGSNEERTFKLEPKLMQLASLEPGKFLNLKVMRMSSDNIQSATIYRKGGEKFGLQRHGEGWRLLRDGQEAKQASEEAQKFVNRLTTLRALKADEAALSPANCERGQSRLSVEFAGVGGKKEALFFQYKPDKKSPVIVCDSARDSLFTVHHDLVQFLELPAEKMVN